MHNATDEISRGEQGTLVALKSIQLNGDLHNVGSVTRERRRRGTGNGGHLDNGCEYFQDSVSMFKEDFSRLML